MLTNSRPRDLVLQVGPSETVRLLARFESSDLFTGNDIDNANRVILGITQQRRDDYQRTTREPSGWS
jgi:hypothetical protein